MKNLIQKILERLVPNYFKEKPELYLQASLVVMLIFTIVMYSCLFFFFAMYLEVEVIMWLNVFLIVSGTSTYGIFRWRKNLSMMAWIFFGVTLIFITTLGHYGGGRYSFAPIFYPIAPLMGFGIGKRKVGIIQSLAIVIWMLGVVPFLETQVFPPYHVLDPDQYQILYLSSIITMIILTSLVMLINEYNREELVRKLQARDQSLLQQDKMASLGALTAGVAHEINNPLNFVSTNTHALRLDVDEIGQLLEEVHQLNVAHDDKQVDKILQKIEELDTEFLFEEIQELIRSIERGATRTQRIVQGLRTFSRNSEDDFVHANIHEGLDSTLSILNNKLKDQIVVHKDYGNLPEIECQFGKLNQVFMNVLANAIQAISGKGDIYIQTHKEANHVIISIRDTGTGIPPELSKRIFDPFFTTKEIGAGTGLGLSISYGIIADHGGDIEVDSQLDQGSTFRIRLPITQG